MAQYVIQKHTRSGSIHWDLMLDTGDMLKTYRLNIGPQELLDKAAQAQPIQDHDKKFLTYEGPVNKGLGSVVIEDAGVFEITQESENRIQLKLQGRVLAGDFLIEKNAENCWQFKKGTA